MTRNEILREISGMPELAILINKEMGQNFTRCKTPILEKYLEQAKNPSQPESKPSDASAFESAALSFLVTLDQKGLLEPLLARIK